jgi:hypothetical protein
MDAMVMSMMVVRHLPRVKREKKKDASVTWNFGVILLLQSFKRHE